MLAAAMAGKKQQARAKVAPAPTAETSTPASGAPRRDLRPLIYLILNQVLVVIYIYVFAEAIPNRHASAFVHLWSLPVLLQLMALGMLARLVGSPTMKRAGWWLGVGGGTGVLLVTVLLIIRILVSAAFLSGVYGAFGKAAAMSALIGIALIVELVALVPLFQVKYLMTRAGRRAFAMRA